MAKAGTVRSEALPLYPVLKLKKGKFVVISSKLLLTGGHFITGEWLRFFYGDPEYGLLEGLMVTVPGFEKKRNEKLIRRNDICTSSYHTKEGVENMVRRIISYKNSDEAMEAAKYLNKNKIFVGNDHKNLIAKICEGHRGKKMNSRSYLAAVFLLSADSELWNRVEKNVTDSGIAVSKIQAVGFNEEQNIIIKIAEQLYNGEHFAWYEELAESEIISKEIFVSIVNKYSGLVGTQVLLDDLFRE